MGDNRGTNWCVVINNPQVADEENINLARQKGWKVEGQLEKGQEGTPHYQLIVKTPQVRFSQVKKAFPRAHIELARNVKALEAYSKKDDTRIGELQSQSELYPSLQKLWDLFADFVNNKQYRCLTDSDPDARLVIFDKFIRYAIDLDYCVETMGVNPQIRSSVKQYGENIVFRSLRRRTDRQTDEENLRGQDITNEERSSQDLSQEKADEEGAGS